MTFAEAADAFNAKHPDMNAEECALDKHTWSDWEFNFHRTCEIRLCATCGLMEQQWIE